MSGIRYTAFDDKAPLMVSISGIRGISGKSLVPSIVEKYVAAFAKLQKGSRLVVGRDSRFSGPWVVRQVHAVLMAMGYEVIDVGIVPTPTVLFMIDHLKTDGCVIVTSSHNPVEWNGLKFGDNNGLFLSPNKCKELFALADSADFTYPSYDKTGKFTEVTTAAQDHCNAIMGLSYISAAADAVKAAKYKVVVDAVNGAGGETVKLVLETLGCTVVGMNMEPTGLFSHPPEPINAHLGTLFDKVREEKADLGVAVDPDSDRCVLVDGNGTPIGEEYTLSLAVEFVLGVHGKRGPVCKNLSTTRAVDDIAKKYDCPVFNTPVGEIQVATKMGEVEAVIGGEGNGGVMLPELHSVRDAPLAAAFTVAHMAAAKKSLAELKGSLPQYEIAKHKAPIEGLNPDEVVAAFKEKYSKDSSVTLNDADGLRIDAKDWWVHLRKSNTEPIVRVIGEAGPLEEGNKLCARFMEEIVAMRK